ncbi:putative transmembrane protein [Helianthus anomalus]
MITLCFFVWLAHCLYFGCRTPLYLGLFGVSFNVAYFVHTSMLLWGFRKSNERWELSSTNALPYITSIGLVSFCL